MLHGLLHLQLSRAGYAGDNVEAPNGADQKGIRVSERGQMCTSRNKR